MGEILPPEIVHRPKRGFVLPMDAWMRGPMRTFCDRRLGSGGLPDRGILKAESVGHLWNKFLQRDPNVTWSRVWLLVALEEWLTVNLDDAAVP